MKFSFHATIAACVLFACAAHAQDTPPAPAFDTASVQQNSSSASDSPATSNFPINSTDIFADVGGHFLATGWTLASYLQFAYKMTDYQVAQIAQDLPAWAMQNRYDIDAQAADPATTKDQMRQMMVALLTDRFQLSVHHQARQLPVFSLQQLNPGQAGPGLVTNASAVPCTNTSADNSGGAPPATTAPWPALCGEIASQAPNPGQLLVGARGVTLPWIADQLAGAGNLDRPVINHTDLSDTYDFSIAFTPRFDRPTPDPQFDVNADPFVQALNAQLGLKITSTNEAVDFIIIDDIELPTLD